MSGHSRWAQIHRAKGAVDAKRGARFTKLGNAITAAAKAGGPNPDSNLKLKLAVEAAKAENFPKENIDRAIARATGAGSGAVEAVTYEGYGPGGVAVIIEGLTNNKNRTSADIRHLLDLAGGSLGAPGSVSWQFARRGVLGVADLNDAAELAGIDAGAIDIAREPDAVTLTCAPQDLERLRAALAANGASVLHAAIELVPNERVTVSDPAVRQRLDDLLAALDDHEDVESYATNAA